MRGVAQPVGTRPETAADAHEYAFLIGSLLDHATLEQAEREAILSGVTTHAVLIASGWVSQPGYTAALAQALGLEAALWGMVIDGSSAVSELPVPLGGTSNHFPRDALVEAGAWDPFNVTADADLGIRLARQHLKTSVLASTTWRKRPSISRPG